MKMKTVCQNWWDIGKIILRRKKQWSKNNDLNPTF